MDNATLALSQLTDVEICAKDARCVREPRHAGLCLIVEDPTARALKLADRLEKEAARYMAMNNTVVVSVRCVGWRVTRVVMSGLLSSAQPIPPQLREC